MSCKTAFRILACWSFITALPCMSIQGAFTRDNAGTATANASFGGDSNHDGSTATQVTFQIMKANAVCTVTGYHETFDETCSLSTKSRARSRVAPETARRDVRGKER